MAKKKAKRRAPAKKAKSKSKLPEPVIELLHSQRQRLFQVQGIVSCARYASDSMLVDGEPNLVDGLDAADNILSEIAEKLEELIPDGYGSVWDEDEE